MTTNNLPSSTVKKILHSKSFQTFTKYFFGIAVIIAILVFGIFTSNYFSPENIINILRTTGIIMCAALGALLILSTGEIDFSIGAQFTFAASIVGRLMDLPAFPNYWLAVLISVGIILISGVVNGLLVVKIRIPSFIATLGVQTILLGCVKFLTNNAHFYSNNWKESYSMVGRTIIGSILPLPLVVMLILAVVVMIILEKTKYGRNLFCVGKNVVAAEQVGIDVKKIKFCVFIISSFLAAIAGIMQTSIVSYVDIYTGTNYLLPIISTCLISATFLTPGKYNVPGLFVATLFTVVVRIGVTYFGGASYASDLATGGILILALILIAVMREEDLPTISFG